MGRSICCILALGIPLAVAGLVSAASDVDLATFMDAVAKSERKLLNLHVRSELWHEEQMPDSSQWQKTGVFLSTTSWHDGLAGSKARIDIDREVLVWTNGEAPYSEDKLSLGFDGRYGRVVYHDSGPMGNAAPMRRAEILGTRPTGLDQPTRHYATGAGFSCHYFFNRHGKMFSQVLREMLTRQEKLTLTDAEIGGRTCLKLLVGEPDRGHEAFWVDPSRGYALLKHQVVNVRRDGAKWTPRMVEVLELVEASEGVWYPTKAIVEIRRPDPQATRSRYVYRAETVVANDPRFDPRVFTVPIPEGYTVRDKVGGIVYRMGLSPEELESRIDDILEEATSASSIAGVSPTARIDKPATDAQQRDASAGEPNARESDRSFAELALLGAVVTAVLAVLVLIGRRARKGRGVHVRN